MKPKQKCSNIKTWTGFKFSMGFFVVARDGKVRIGKCDPITKKVIELVEL